jgi:hypothetical protein
MAEKDTQAELNEFLDRKAKRDVRENRIMQWHIKAHVVGGIILPYNADDTYVSLDFHEWDDEARKYNVNVEKSLDNLAKVAKYAAKQGKKVKKSYDSSFNLEVTIYEAPEDSYGEYDITVTYHANREAVCRKVVVGYEDVPEKVTPATRKEIIEWECDPISLLAHEEV